MARGLLTWASAWVLLWAAAGFAGAQQPKPASPREAFERAKSAIAAKDWEGLWNLFSDQAQEEFIAEVIKTKRRWREQPKADAEPVTGKIYGELLRMTWKQLFVAFLTGAQGKKMPELDAKGWSCEGEKTKGEEGEVYFKDAGGRERTLALVKQDDAWEFADFKILEGGRRMGADNEASAQASLKCISTGQEQFKNAVCVDTNTNGVGEYGFLGELGGFTACRGGGAKHDQNPFVPSILGKVNAKGVSVKSGYCFIVYLPSGAKSATSVDAGAVSAPIAESGFRAFAWPVEKGKTGDRAFLIDPQGEVCCRVSEWSGPDNPPPWDTGFSAGDGWNGTVTRDWVPMDQIAAEGPEPMPFPPGAMSYEKAKKVFMAYFAEVLDATRQKKEVKSQEMMDRVARADGFKNWNDYATQAVESLGPEKWKRLCDEVSRWYAKEVEKWVKEMEEEAKKGEEGGGERK
jgi:hypothetical protein